MRGVWKCRLRVSGRPLGAPTPRPRPGPARSSSATAGGGSFRLSSPWRVPPHTAVLCRYVLMAPVLKSFFIKIHRQHVKTRSFQVTGASECALECRVHGPELWSLGHLLSGRPGEVRQSSHGAREHLPSTRGLFQAPIISLRPANWPQGGGFPPH